MEPNLIEISHFSVSGLSTRTTNHAELSQDTARIPNLWGRFYEMGLADNIPDRQPGTPVFGVYSAYESDATGAYDLTVGVSVSQPAPQFKTIDIQAGKYLVFEARGPMPGAVIQAWVDIWTYFEQHLHIHRSYLTDFESWCGLEAVQIHIGIETH